VRFSVVLSARFGCDEVLSIDDDILDWVNVSSHLSTMVGDDGNRSSMLFPIRINDLSISFWRAFGDMEQKVMSLLLLLFKIDGAGVGGHSIMFACSFERSMFMSEERGRVSYNSYIPNMLLERFIVYAIPTRITTHCELMGLSSSVKDHPLTIRQRTSPVNKAKVA
jgi:hypothetical protein